MHHTRHTFLGIMMAMLIATPFTTHAADTDEYFENDQVRTFTRSVLLQGGIKATATILALQKHEKSVTKVFDHAFGQLQEVAVNLDASDTDSDIGRLNATRAGHPVEVSAEAIELLQMAKKASRMTGGAYDFIGSTVGKSSDVKLEKKKQLVTLKQQGTRIDISAVLDGYLADQLMKTVWNANIDNAMVEVGNSTRSVGNNVVGPWRRVVSDMVGRYAGRGMAISFSNAATATVKMGTKQPSANATRKQHEPVAGICRSATVIAKDAAMADAFANAIYKLGPDEGIALARRLPNVHAIIRDGAGNLHKTPGI